MQNNFSVARLLNLAKSDFVTERRTLFVVALSLVGLMMLPYLLKLIPYMSVEGSSFHPEVCAKSSFFVIFVLWLIGISSSFKIYISRLRASAALMLPATNGEKFLLIFVRTLIVNVMAMVAIGIAIQLLWSVAMGVPMSWSIWFYSSAPNWMREVMMSCFIHSFYLLGATIFRRNAFVYTSLCGFGVLMLSLMGIGMYYFMTSIQFDNDFPLSTTFKIVLYVITIALTVAMWWLSWRRFTKLQLKK